MRNYILDLPKYRLNLSFKLVKRRKPLVPDDPIIVPIKQIKNKYRSGSLATRISRHLFGHAQVGKLIGVAISFVAITCSFFPPSKSALAAEEVRQNVVSTEAVILHTEVGTQYPTNPIKITQRYSFFHPALDLDGITGDPIKPIKKGKVIEISQSKYAYGNSVIVDHGNGLTSLYAHLSKIEVKKDQEVTTDTLIGKMGATGRAFGDHLHLEIRLNGRNLNPITVLPKN